MWYAPPILKQSEDISPPCCVLTARVGVPQDDGGDRVGVSAGACPQESDRPGDEKNFPPKKGLLKEQVKDASAFNLVF